MTRLINTALKFVFDGFDFLLGKKWVVAVKKKIIFIISLFDNNFTDYFW